MKYPLIGLLLLACVANLAHAEDKPGAREREALRRAQAQLQTVQQAQTALQDKLRVTDEEKAALEQRFKGEQARATAGGQKSKQLQTALDAAQEDNRTALAAKAELEQRLKATQERVAVLEKEQAQTSAQLKTAEATLLGRTRQVNSCEQHNSALYEAGRKLVAQCQDGSTLQTTPLSQLPARLSGEHQVAFETQLESLRDQLDNDHLLSTERAQ